MNKTVMTQLRKILTTVIFDTKRNADVMLESALAEMQKSGVIFDYVIKTRMLKREYRGSVFYRAKDRDNYLYVDFSVCHIK